MHDGSGTVQNCPSDWGAIWQACLCLTFNDQRHIQYAFNGSTGTVMKREGAPSGSSISWGDWGLVYDHSLLSNSSELSSLASALGGLITPQVSDNDFNNFKNGVYFVALGSSAQNAPGSYSEYRGYVRSLLGDYSVQFYYDVQQHTLFVRDKTGSWSSWRQIAIS